FRRAVDGGAGRRVGTHQRRMGEGRRGRRGTHRGDPDQGGDQPPGGHVSERPLPVSRATRPSTSATPATARATMPSVDDPPPNDDTPSVRGAGSSLPSAPVHSATEPSEYVSLTSIACVPSDGTPTNRNTASCPAAVLPPLQVTRRIVASSPLPLVSTCADQPGASSRENTATPSGTSISTWVIVVPPLFSLGTSSVYSWDAPDVATAGLSWACARAAGATARPTAATASPTTPRTPRGRVLSLT